MIQIFAALRSAHDCSIVRYGRCAACRSRTMMAIGRTPFHDEWIAAAVLLEIRSCTLLAESAGIRAEFGVNRRNYGPHLQVRAGTMA